jgi:hypothetical protein
MTSARPLSYWYTKAGEDDCWYWHGGKSNGYGVCRIKGVVTRAHIAVYRQLKGDYPSYLQLDHLCKHPACVNPKHLEPVTAEENKARGSSWQALNAKKTYCPQGHEYTVENTYKYPSGRRECRICRTANVARFRSKI